MRGKWGPATMFCWIQRPGMHRSGGYRGGSMRTKSSRWASSRGAFTFTPSMELVGITADFAGGFVRVDAIAQEVNPTATNWAALQVMVDGVSQGPARIVWQGTGQGNVQVSLNHSVRVPPGRHRVSVLLTSSNATAWSGNGGYIEVTESP